MKNTLMNQISLTRSLIIWLLFTPTLFAQVESNEVLLNRVLCIVDSRPIFHSDIQKKVEVGPIILVSEFPSDKEASPYEKALNDAINFELILSASKDLDIEVSDSDLELEIGRYLEEQRISKEKLVDLLKNEGETYEGYRSDFKNQLILRRFQRKVIAPSIKVTDKDIETYYLTQSNTDNTDSIEVTLQQIQISIRPDQPKELQEARKLLVQDLGLKLKSTTDFTEAAGLYSDENSSTKGAPFTVRLKDLASNLKSSIEALKPGEVSNPIPIGPNFLFIKLVDRKVTLNREFETQKQKLEQELKILELRNQTNKWLSEQRQRSTIKYIQD